MKSWAAAAVAALLLAVSGAGRPAAQTPAGPPLERVSFNHQIRPLLSDRCFRCHGPDEKQRKGGLRLDDADAAREALAPGRPEASEVLARITTHDPADKMPPADAQTTLTAEQIETLKTWIAEGALFEPHWAFIKPQRPAVPTVQRADWPRNPGPSTSRVG